MSEKGKGDKIKVGVLGATGFTGEKLVEILKSHSKVKISCLTSRTPYPVPYSVLFPRFKNLININCEPLNIKKVLKKADLFFLSLPHKVSMEVVPYFLKAGKRVIDLSADYRIKDVEIYKKFYGVSHKDKNNLKKAVYGMPEFFKEKIKNAQLVANPGCYANSIILALAPLAEERLIKPDVVVNSYSSVTGAGRRAVIDYHFANVEGNIWAYKPFVHQHLPEVLQVLKELGGVKLGINFVPHVVDVAAGIYSTIYVCFRKKATSSALKRVYKKYYEKSAFVRVMNGLPRLKNIVGTNFCDIGFSLDKEGRKAVVVSALDNLIKGAAGAAVQNMNIMLGYKESEGLL